MIKYFSIERKYPIKCKAFLPSSGKVETVILGVHGFAGDKESSMLSELAKSVDQMDGALICFDFPAHGDSDGREDELTVENCVHDLLTVAEWIEDAYPTAEKFIFATSFGGYISLISLRTLTNYKVILRAPAVTMPKVLLESVLKISAEQFEEFGAVECGFERKITLPYSFYKGLLQYDLCSLKFDNKTLVFHGDKDDIVPIEDVMEFCESRENVNLIIIKNADHRFKNPGEIESIVSETVQFMEKAYD